jgi:hypothetical protein
MKPVHATARAAALLLSSVPAIALGAPATCADVLKKVEKRLLDAGTQQAELKIVPKGLSTGSQVLASCEGGTQHIVRRGPSAASAPVGKRAQALETTGTKR